MLPKLPAWLTDAIIWASACMISMSTRAQADRGDPVMRHVQLEEEESLQQGMTMIGQQ